MIGPRRLWRTNDRSGRFWCSFCVAWAAFCVASYLWLGTHWFNLAVAVVWLPLGYGFLVMGYRRRQLKWIDEVQKRRVNAPWN